MIRINDAIRGDQLGKRANDWYVWMACPKCQTRRWVLKWKRKLPNFTGLCLRCNGIRFRPKWNNGMMKSSTGYIFIHSPQHPSANSKGYVKRSRLVLEKKLGRYLFPQCVPHHLNGIRDDDRFNNLLEISNSRHKSLHIAQRKLLDEAKFSARREVAREILSLIESVSSIGYAYGADYRMAILQELKSRYLESKEGRK